MTTNVSVHQLHLTANVVTSGVVPSKMPVFPWKIEVSAGISWLVVEESKPPRLVRDSPPESLKRQHFVIEPVFIAHQQQAILVSPPGRRARVHGQLAPFATLIGPGDTVMLDSEDEHLLHVALYQRVPVAKCPEQFVGKDCPICRVPFRSADELYLCVCGVALHWKSAPGDGQEPLTCAQDISECPSSFHPIVKTEGYASLPEEFQSRGDQL
jgi:hypothetical protein